jgi:mannose-6-phosphate isomerase-like protein (cupin superfamily)
VTLQQQCRREHSLPALWRSGSTRFVGFVQFVPEIFNTAQPATDTPRRTFEIIKRVDPNETDHADSNKEFTMEPSSGLKKAMFSDATSVDWFEPLPGEKIGMRLESEHTGNAFSLTEIIVAPQAGPPLHIHHDADELLFVLEGTVDFVCNNERFRTGPGGFAAMPRGVPHAFRNFENTAARMIVLLSPGGFEQVMPAMKGRPVSDFPSIAATYDLEVVGTQISPIDG